MGTIFEQQAAAYAAHTGATLNSYTEFYGSTRPDQASQTPVFLDRWYQLPTASIVVPPTGPPTGPGYVSIETLDPTGGIDSATNLWVYGSGVTLQSMINAAGSNVLTFPPGIFEFNDFATGGIAGLFIPTVMKGLWGSGMNSTTGTVIRMKAGTSTKASSVPVQSTAATNPLYLIRMRDGSDQVLKNFQLQGTNQQTDPNTGQPHCYNGVMAGTWPDGHPATIENVLINGIRGDAGSQPGETFGLNIFSCLDVVIKNVEVDGRMVDGTRVGSSPIGFNSVRGTPGFVQMENVYAHHAKIGQITFWQTTDVTTLNCRSVYNTRAWNHERTERMTHINPTALVDRTLSPNGMHFAFSNPSALASTWPDCATHVIQNATHLSDAGSGLTDPGLSGASGKLMVMVPDIYAGAANGQTSLPVMKDSSGTTVVFTTVAFRYH